MRIRGTVTNRPHSAIEYNIDLDIEIPGLNQLITLFIQKKEKEIELIDKAKEDFQRLMEEA